MKTDSRVTVTPMKDIDHCIICHTYIGKGNDPAVCSDKCKELYLFECEYNKMCKEYSEIHNKSNYNRNTE